jgi:YYY domain-containing protein
LLLDILRWWVSIQALSLALLPITMWFFAHMPDRGYSFAKPLGLLLVGYGAWLLAMVGFGGLSSMLLIVVTLMLASASCFWLGRSALRQMIIDLRQRVGWIIFQETLFVAALYAGIWLRWHDFFGRGAAILHTEQPMDLAFLSGILASPHFPPQDPWFATYPINYYYLGYLFVAALIRLSGVSVAAGFNLGLATIFALTAVGVAGLVRNLIELTENRGPKTKSWRYEDAEKVNPQVATRNSRSGLGRWLFPLLGVVLVLFSANQAGALQVIVGSEKVVALQPSQLVTAIRNGLGLRKPIDLPPTFPADEFDGDSRLVPTDKVEDFNAWWPSRAVWDDLQGPDEQSQRVYAITEFPVFSFLLGDLHPHVLSLPWSLLAVTVALNVLLRRTAPDFRSPSGLLRLLLSAIVVGGLYAINSWDLPTYLLLYLGSLTLLYLRLAPTPRAFFWPHFVIQAGVMVVASYFLYVLFHLTFIAPTEGFPLALAPAHTGLVEFLIIFGLFFIPLLAYTIQSLRALTAISRQLQPLFGGAVLTLALLVGLLIGWPLLMLLPLAVLACLSAYEHREQPATAFALWLFALGALVIWGVDVIHLRDNYGSPRMNTIFKFYYQVWLLWGTLAAYALWALLRKLRWSLFFWLVPFVFLLLGSFVYPVLAPSDSITSRTLDGLDFLRQERPAEAAAIEWLKRQMPGDALVLQAPGASYRSDTARIASATGRPTLVGWTGHESLWRGGQPDALRELQAREQDVRTIYTTTDAQQARTLLEQYDVQYVYVGQHERSLVAEAGAQEEALTKFDQFMQRVFEQDDVIIYGWP